MKRTTSSDLGKTLVCVIYVIVSFFLLGYALEGKSEKSVYDMGVVWLDTSNYLGDTADYRQWFYAPCECSGIQVAIATDQTEAQNNLVVRILNKRIAVVRISRWSEERRSLSIRRCRT